MPSALLVATIIVHAILIQPITYCLWKHGRPGIIGWQVLQTFCAIRIVGSALQIRDEKNGSITTATLVISNIGLSPMLLGVAGVLHEARTIRDPTMNTKVEWMKVIAFHAQVILAMVLTIFGVTHQISDKTRQTNILMKVGVMLLLLSEVVLAVWTWLSFHQVPRTHLTAWSDATLLLKTVFAVLPYVFLRTLYSILTTFITNPSFKTNTAARVCLSVVPEMLLVTGLAVAGIRTRNIVKKSKVAVEQPTSSGQQEYLLLQTPLQR